MQVLGTFTSLRKAVAVRDEYEEETGLYARIVNRQVKAEDGKKRKYLFIVYGCDTKCTLQKYFDVELRHEDLEMIAKHYINLIRDKVRYESWSKITVSPYVRKMFRNALDAKMGMREEIERLFSNHPLTRLANMIDAMAPDRAKGKVKLGPLYSAYILGNVDPHIATTAGKAKAILAFTPRGKLRRNRSAEEGSPGRIQVKGPIYFNLGKRVAYGPDSYYRPLFEAKKEYYLTVRGLPQGVADGKAVFWIAALLICHGWEIIRQAEGLPINTNHNPYIPPKQYPDQTPPKELLDIIRTGRREKI